jgi:hypothetical protein
MAERKSGPVKPPVIDLTARPAKPIAAEDTKPTAEPQATTIPPTPEAAEPKPQPEPAKAEAKPVDSKPVDSRPPEAKPAGAKPVDSKSTAPKPAKPVAPAKPVNPWLYAGLGAIGGAILGTGLTFGLATAGLLPPTAPAFANPAPQLADQANRIAALEGKLADSTGQVAGLAKTVDAQKADIATLQSAKPPTVDLAPIDSRLKTLSDRVEAIAAGASSADAGALAANLAALQKSLGDLGSKVTALSDAQSATDGKLGALNGEIAAAKAALAQEADAAKASATNAAAQLPIALTGLENAFAVGRPYAAELASLRTLQPNVSIPPSVAEHAETGLARPDDLTASFTAALPDILAAEPAKPNAGWQDAAMNWAKTVLALRPAGEISGTDPDAVTSRLEAAIGRHDYAAATSLFAALPEPMRLAAKDLPQQVATQAEAQNFLAGLRSSAGAAK